MKKIKSKIINTYNECITFFNNLIIKKIRKIQISHTIGNFFNNFIRLDFIGSSKVKISVFNKYLIDRISYYTQVDIIMQDNDTVNFKEAIIFGFLGVLRVLNQNNCLAFSTGAYRDHCSGDVYML